jgi:phosphonate transport system substrate-binding protein
VSTLRFITYLAPTLPEPLFAVVARHVGVRLGLPTSLVVDERFSGPWREGADPFSTGEADVGFLCAPPFLWLQDRAPPAVELVPAGWAFDDPRAAGAPVYFSDVIVAAGSDARRFEDLRGGVWAYNDLCSLSGFHCLLRKLRPLGMGGRFFAETRASGSHLASIDWVARGLADGAAIDSNGLRLALRRDPGLGERIRIIESWGPHPVQPVVARAGLPADLRRAIADALLGLHRDPEVGAAWAEFGVSGFVPVDDSLYAAERAALASTPVPEALLAAVA